MLQNETLVFIHNDFKQNLHICYICYISELSLDNNFNSIEVIPLFVIIPFLM